MDTCTAVATRHDPDTQVQFTSSNQLEMSTGALSGNTTAVENTAVAVIVALWRNISSGPGVVASRVSSTLSGSPDGLGVGVGVGEIGRAHV